MCDSAAEHFWIVRHLTLRNKVSKFITICFNQKGSVGNIITHTQISKYNFLGVLMTGN